MGLTAYIYRSDWNDPKNLFYGLKSVHVFNVDGPFTPEPGEAVALLEKHTPGACRLVPARLEYGQWVAVDGMCAGGTYAAAGDSRFTQAVDTLLGSHFYGAIAVHDRLHWNYEN
jgi:hypothetical protein